MASNHSNDYIKFIARINTLRYQHAVVSAGQKLLHLILRILIHGDINDISGVVEIKLTSKNQFKNSFTKDEHDLLEEGDHIKWDVSLLFKIIQKVCGLAPSGDSSWKQPTGGQECLEYHIYTLKELRNKLVHNFELVLSEDQLNERLNELTDLAFKTIEALEECAQRHGRNLPTKEKSETMDLVLRIVDNVRAKIVVEAVPESVCSDSASSKVSKNMINNEDEEDIYESDKIQSDNQRLAFDKALVTDNVYSAAGAREQLPLDPSLEEVLEDLTRKFWLCAGSKESVC